MLEKGWGLMFHYLDADSPADSKEHSRTTAEEWNARVDGFDTGLLRGQLRQLQPGWVIWTVGQNSGHYCAPNEAYDAIVGHHPSKCARRDLVADIGRMLREQGIRLIVYVPSGAPEADPQARERLQWAPAHPTPGVTVERQAEFQRMWERILREWSLRWGDMVSGWWIDGCYAPDAMYRHADAPNFSSLAGALRAGNPHAAVAFNGGVKTPIQRLDEVEDYTAGECDIGLPIFRDHVPWGHERTAAQFHALSFLGAGWGVGSPRLPAALVKAYTQYLQSQQGGITWDIPLVDDRLPEEYVLLLQGLTPNTHTR